MNTRYEVSEQHGKTVDTLTDAATGTRLSVVRLGAEPFSSRGVAQTAGGPASSTATATFPKAASGWNNHATLMGYYIHRLKDKHSVYRGHEIVGDTHSFLRHKTFPEPEVDIADGRASLTYTMLPSGYEPSEYPYRVSLALTYSLEADGAWRVRFRFQSQEAEVSTHVSFGLHPGFAVGSLEAAQLLLPPGIYRRHFAPGNYLSGETVDLAHPGGPWAFDRSKLVDSYLLEPVGVKEKIFTLDDPAGGRRVELDYTEVPYLTVWSDGHPYLCVEPCWGLPDAQAQVPFEEKAGILEIVPGGVLERGCAIRATVA